MLLGGLIKGVLMAGLERTKKVVKEGAPIFTKHTAEYYVERE